ncbi:LysR substrate-binding domain-containing protein [Methylobacterium sp. NEAU 140]|uniref:LysR substrate-binding domain-containing protein n=1 Tax=Methylobacterium sp. NEAU 140 TaxID=3064945 RepID=UPI0027369A09|nr:LysR substrate-binding domain-containing protein [Methylobacterium sp. NEAU 140]MDP4026140.1 LysR substrate-binding domain-containing protein [Methylobacterium sp. NEAU 140]
MRRIPSFPSLRAFEAAARLGSFARASEELHLTPSAVSHQVRALEQHFGRALFRRANRQATLTADGERLLSGLSGAFDAIEAACAELKPSPAPSLAVHCTPSFAAKWLSPRLPSFVDANPGIGIRVSSGAEPLDLGRHAEIDVLIAYGRPPGGSGLRVESLGPEEIAALCTPELARSATAIEAGAIKRLTWLDSSFSPVRWADWFTLNGLPAPTTQAGPAFDRGSLIISAAVQGLGVALESLRFARDELAAGQLVRFGDGSLRSIYRDLHFLCYRERDMGSVKIRRFHAWILDQEHHSAIESSDQN